MKVIISESIIDQAIYDYLNDNCYPDYNWGPELHDFYREEIEDYGSYTFEINDEGAFSYYGNDKYLFVYGDLSDKLTNFFGDYWKPVFIKWFEDNSGLKVDNFSILKINKVPN